MTGEYAQEGETKPEKKEEEKIWQAKIILERHGDYYNPKTGTADFEKLEKESKVGMLTEKGVNETKEAARKKFSEIVEDGKPVDFIFLHSPSGRVDFAASEGKMQEGYGKRGWDTAQVTMDTILEEAKKSIGLDKSKELTEEETDKFKEKFRFIGVGSSKKLREADVFHKTYIEGLEQTFGDKFQWLENYYNGSSSKDKTMKLLRKKSDTENIHDVSRRIDELVNNLVEFASDYEKKYGKDRKLVIWAFTHQAALRAFAEHGLNIPQEEAANYQPKNNETIDIDMMPGDEIIYSVKEKKYKIRE